MNWGNNDAGADGSAFVLHNDPRGTNALGNVGSYLGVAGPQAVKNALAVAFDTYQSAPGVESLGASQDIAKDHSLIFSPGNSAAGYGANGQVALGTNGNIEDGAWHRIKLDWTYASATTQTLTLTFDGVQVDSKTGNLISSAFGGSQYAYFAYTAGTGGLAEDIRVRPIATNVTYEGSLVNSPPVVGVAMAPQNVAEDTAFSFAVPAGTFADVDDASLTLTASLAAGALWTAFGPPSAFLAAGGVCALVLAGLWLFVPKAQLT